MKQCNAVNYAHKYARHNICEDSKGWLVERAKGSLLFAEASGLFDTSTSTVSTAAPLLTLLTQQHLAQILTRIGNQHATILQVTSSDHVALDMLPCCASISKHYMEHLENCEQFSMMLDLLHDLVPAPAASMYTVKLTWRTFVALGVPANVTPHCTSELLLVHQLAERVT